MREKLPGIPPQAELQQLPSEEFQKRQATIVESMREVDLLIPVVYLVSQVEAVGKELIYDNFGRVRPTIGNIQQAVISHPGYEEYFLTHPLDEDTFNQINECLLTLGLLIEEDRRRNNGEDRFPQEWLVVPEKKDHTT